MKNDKEYFVGLDIGTDSVGYAVTDERYKLIKIKGEPAWGSHLFDAANQCADRRSFRTGRRRLNRRKQRVALADEIFMPEVVGIDPDFYVRKKESALYAEDRTDPSSAYLYFNEGSFDEREYYQKYPTIHHLICDLMNDEDTVFDIRLINIAVDWLVAHRGHFLSDVRVDHVDKVLDFEVIYDGFVSYFDNEGLDMPWDKVDVSKFGGILKSKKTINSKKAELKELLYPSGIPEDNDYIVSRKKLIDFLAGGSVKYSTLFQKEDIEEDISMKISDDMDVLLPQLGDDAELIAKIALMYDWSVLSDILDRSTCISEAKVKQYVQHSEDLKKLKSFVKKYVPEKYYEVFRESDANLKNYTAYAYNVKYIKKGKVLPKGKAKREEFLAYLKKTLKLDKLVIDESDKEFYDDMVERINNGTFLPKQVNSDNRVIPYQLYYAELIRVLKNAAKHYPFLNEKDSEGYSNTEKILSIFEFKIPYYVGPLRKDNSKIAWIVRRSEGKIYPWNFDEKVDRDKSEDAFIDRMTNKCSYLPGEDVLPKWSTAYAEFTVLNEINNLKCNGKPISVEAKQGVFDDLFMKFAKVTPKRIREYMLSRGYMQKEDELSGIDVTIKSSLKPYIDFRRLLADKVLTKDEVDEIVKRSTYTEDKVRFRKWLRDTYPMLTEDDFKYVGRLQYRDFGRLSYKFLCGITGANKETGESGSIMHFLWETNDNLMQLLSDKYTFTEIIRDEVREYYSDHPSTISDQLEAMGISNAVKRPVIRTLAVVKDVVSAMGHAPKKIFVEMARGGVEEQKKKRTVSRKEQLIELYKTAKEDTKELEKELETMGDMANNKLQAEALYLYYMQLGKCMYCGKAIDVGQIKSTTYNVDHIYPQSLIKDDSVMNNKVLVHSEENANKSNELLDPSIRVKMYPMWRNMLDNNLITKEKYSRLMRSTPFTEEEKMGFINRQLVETRQSMKAVTQVLQNIYPNTEIVYVKAKLAADFKQEFKLAPKSRIINDLHHAKDAYLNLVAGNVYNERFTKKWFNVNREYSLKTKALFGKDLVHGDKVIWDSKTDFETVKSTYRKNCIHLTRYAFCQKGGLFDQMPLKKGQGQVQLKKGMDIEKYGGYNKPSASFFVVVRYLKGGKREVSFVPVDLMVSDKFLNDEAFATDYVKGVLEGMNRKKIEAVELPLGKRVVKIKSVLSLDGYRVWLNGKSSGGSRLLITSAESLVLSDESVRYVKKIENYLDKKKNNPSFKHDADNDGLSKEKNIILYDELTHKLENKKYINMPGNQFKTLAGGRNIFVDLEFDLQLQTLLSCITLLK